MATLGALDGTDVFIEVKEQPGDTWVILGGQISHTETLVNNLIEITTKTADSNREILPEQGIQQVDYTSEINFNSQLGYDFVRALAGNKAIAEFRISSDGNIVTTVELMVASFVDSSVDGEALQGSINLISSDNFEWDL